MIQRKEGGGVDDSRWSFLALAGGGVVFTDGG